MKDQNWAWALVPNDAHCSSHVARASLLCKVHCVHNEIKTPCKTQAGSLAHCTRCLLDVIHNVIHQHLMNHFCFTLQMKVQMKRHFMAVSVPKLMKQVNAFQLLLIRSLIDSLHQRSPTQSNWQCKYWTHDPWAELFGVVFPGLTVCLANDTYWGGYPTGQVG